ncbi:MAG TPA: helix-hairpin-helix domain-containing protein [Thermoanaerobaculia bacterium]|nr:helix-hairpin-helix domain-containing protein [Thermoanaerobaculia bacterium]
MRKSLTFMVLAVLITLFTAAPALAEDAEPQPASKGAVVNINTADATQLALLPRIGPAAAKRIIEYREANGGFKRTTDLMQVKGIGDKTFELISPHLVTEGKTTLSTKLQGPRKPRTKSAASGKASPSNTAQ